MCPDAELSRALSEKTMLELRQFARCAVFGLSTMFARTAAQTDLSHPAENRLTRVRVYAPGAGVAAPDLLPAEMSSSPISPCELKVDGKVYLSFLVDTAGVPHNLTFLQPVGSDLDELAVRVVSEDRFKPGTLGGVPVVVAESVEVTLHTCLLTVEAETRQKTYRLRLRSTPEQKFTAMQNPPKDAILEQEAASDSALNLRTSHVKRARNGVIAPVPIHSLEVKILSGRQKSRFQQSCLISVVVDSHGMPIEPKVLRGLNPALDLEALEAVRSHRFRPATQDGLPVPIRIVMEVSFLFY
jgi:TonB family protein